jgi:nitroimidazol reductase NimA-like FMN-containing flavoprotein (pyridoxamine 5'-phosphate oxidase superfamily)
MTEPSKLSDDPAALARSIIEANLYMVLGTADETGHPWVSPVYFASDGDRAFYWVSSPEARHSVNISARREVSIVVFDSSVPIGTGQGVYMAALADELVSGDELEAGLDVYGRRALAHGGRAWTAERVQGPARHRFYRATATEHYILDDLDRRFAITP